MARVISIQGIAKGKVGSMVYSTVGGQMIARSYNPYVKNPNTVAQTNQRASFKLLSQIAAVMAPVIAIPKEGLRSSRNLFVKKNSGLVSANNGVAQITYENLQLTNSSVGIPSIVATRSSEDGIQIELAEDCSAALSRVVYMVYRKTSENTLQYVQSTIVTDAGDEGTFPGTLLYVEGDIVLFAYGMKDLNASATAKYADYSVTNGEDVARLVLTRNISMSDFQFTQTRGTTMFADENETTPVGDNEARVYVTATAGGTASGAGVFTLGSSVTVSATPNDGYMFAGWRENGGSTIISTAQNYTFTLTGQTDLVAVFEEIPAGQQYTIQISYDSARGSVSPSGTQTVNAGSSLTVTASADPGYHFTGWKKQGTSTYLSTDAEYTFTPNESFTLVAEFDEDI